MRKLVKRIKARAAKAFGFQTASRSSQRTNYDAADCLLNAPGKKSPGSGQAKASAWTPEAASLARHQNSSTRPAAPVSDSTAKVSETAAPAVATPRRQKTAPARMAVPGLGSRFEGQKADVVEGAKIRVSSGTRQPTSLHGKLPATQRHHTGIPVKKSPDLKPGPRSLFATLAI